MGRRNSLAALLALAVGTTSPAATAHDFWLEVAPFTAQAPQAVGVSTRVGHAGDSGPWPLSPERVLSFQRLGPDGLEDLQARVHQPVLDGTVAVGLPVPGLHILALSSGPAYSELDAARFDAYVAEEGVQPIARHRAQGTRASDAGRETYSRRGKALVQVGPPSAADRTRATRPVGLTLELTPLVHPLDVAPGAPLSFELRYRGVPVPGATVHRGRLDAACADACSALKTDDRGRISLPRPVDGDWMLHVVWADVIEPAAAWHPADYDTVFSSLTFGF